MIKSILSLTGIATVIISGACAHKQESNGGGNPNAAALTSSAKVGYRLPAFEEKTLPNGLRVLFIPDAGLPYVTFSMLVKSGAATDPADQAGLANFVAELLDKGSVKRSAPQIAQDIGQIGADYDAQAAPDFTTIGASSLSMEADRLLTTFHEIVTQPAFADAEVERMRKQIVAFIQRRVDNPDAFVNTAFQSYLFGDHPYGRPSSGTVKSISAIKKKNIIQAYVRHYRPNNSLLAVVGKFTPEFAKKIESTFGTWTARDVTPPTFPPVTAPQGLQIRLIDKPGLVQAQVRMGHLGIKRKIDDFVAVRVANTILGGAFASRLNSRIRKDLGLTYGVSSIFDARLDRGPFEITTFTKNETTGQLVSEALKVLKEFRDKGVTSKEVDATKGYLKGIFPTAIETPEKLAANMLLLRFYGVPDSYLSQYLIDIDKLSTSDVNRAIKTHFDDKNLKVVVYSSAPAVEAQLKAIGPVEVVRATQE